MNLTAGRRKPRRARNVPKKAGKENREKKDYLQIRGIRSQRGHLDRRL
jgi:hypothetical protein